VEAFENNKNVAFGDVNLSEEQVRKSSAGVEFNPGAGGWPTVRYFNKETGYGGAAYDKKTDKSMCDELGDDEIMQGLVMTAGKTSLCAIDAKVGCSDRESKFIDQMSTKSSAEIADQLKRLNGMSAGKMTPDLMKWLSQRIAILKQFNDKEEL